MLSPFDIHQTLPRWRVHFAPAAWARPKPAGRADWDKIVSWHKGRSLEPGTPFLLDHDAKYDRFLNRFFTSSLMLVRAPRTRIAYAQDIARFLTFLLRISSDTQSWTGVNQEHRRSYYYWRNLDAEGPRVKASTWNREVASLSQFYNWAERSGYVSQSPPLDPNVRRLCWHILVGIPTRS